MNSIPKPLVAGNWKMNGLKSSLSQISLMSDEYHSTLKTNVDLLICPPFTLLAGAVAASEGMGIAIGGQDCHARPNGAHTGDISAEMLVEAGARYVITGHSERRADHSETDSIVKAKAEAALRAGLIAIVCIGETEGERKSGKTLDVVGRQLAGSIPPGAAASTLVIAYEPVWAIGTGLTPSAADVAQVHEFIRARLVEILGGEGHGVRILYGGSVKPSNAGELLAVANVNGALVGGASLTARDFMEIASIYR